MTAGRYSNPPDAAKLEESTRRLEASNERLEMRLGGGQPATKLIYVAGPFTAPTPDQIRDNIRRAAALGHEVRKLGAGVLVPHLLGAPYVHAACAAQHPDDFGYRWWIAETLEHMRRCDAVIMTPDWESSNGARGERDEARKNGQPCFLSLAQLKDWLGAQQ